MNRSWQNLGSFGFVRYSNRESRRFFLDVILDVPRITEQSSHNRNRVGVTKNHVAKLHCTTSTLCHDGRYNIFSSILRSYTTTMATTTTTTTTTSTCQHHPMCSTKRTGASFSTDTSSSTISIPSFPPTPSSVPSPLPSPLPPSVDMSSIWQQKTVRLLETPLGTLDGKGWNEAHSCILWWLDSSSPSVISSARAIHTSFQILDRLCQEEVANRRSTELQQQQPQPTNTTDDDITTTTSITTTSMSVPPFFQTDLLNLVVNHWRMILFSSSSSSSSSLSSLSSQRSHTLLLDDTNPEVSIIQSFMSPQNVLDRLYRYQETSHYLQPDRKTYSMVMDGIASVVTTTSSPPRSMMDGIRMIGTDTVESVENAPFTRVAEQSDDVMALVNKIIENLIRQSTLIDNGDNDGNDADDTIQDVGTQLDDSRPTPPPIPTAATMSPNVFIFSSAINAWAKSGRRDAPMEVEKLLHQMKSLHEVYPHWEVAPNSVTYATVIDTWAKVGRVDKVQGLLNEMYQRHQATGDPSIKPGLPAFNGLLVSLSKSGSTSEAEATLKQMEDLYDSGELSECPSVVSYSTVLDGFSRSNEEGAATRAESFLRKMISRHGTTSPNAITYNSVIQAHVQAGDIHSAERLLNEMQDSYLRGENTEVRPTIRTYSIVLSGLAKSRQPDAGERAEQILHAVKEMSKSGDLDESPDVIMYNIVLDCWAKSASRDALVRSKQFLDKMIEDSVAPDEISYNTVIHCMTRFGNPEEAESLIEDMKGAGVQPSNVTYNTLLAAYLTKSSSTNGRRTMNGSRTTLTPSEIAYTSRAEKLFERMKNDPYVEPDVVTYNTMLHFYSRVGDFTKAEAFLAEMLKEDSPVRPNSISLNTVISAWANSGRPDAPQRSEDILINMLESSSKGERPSNLHPTSTTFNGVMSAWTKSRAAVAGERCQRLYQLMVGGLAENGQEFVKPDIVTLNTLIHSWSLADDENAPDHAEAAFLDMKRRYDAGNTRMRPNSKTYGSLISVWAKSGRRNAGEKAEEYMRKILEYYAKIGRRRTGIDAPRVFEFTSTIRAWANSGDPRALYKADEILNLLLREVRQGNDLARPDAYLFGTILRTMAQSKVPNKALYTEKIIRMMKEYKVPPNRYLMDQVKKCYDDDRVQRRL
jgi:pentatricopeptide repeat protein